MLATQEDMKTIGDVVEKVILANGPELNPLMIATAAIAAYEQATGCSKIISVISKVFKSLGDDEQVTGKELRDLYRSLQK
jgi:hypothetical protein